MRMWSLGHNEDEDYTLSGIIIIGAVMVVASVSLVSSPDTLLTQTAIVSATTGSQNAVQRVAVGQGSSASVQYYTYTPQ